MPSIPPPRASGFTTTTEVPLYWARHGVEGGAPLLVLHGAVNRAILSRAATGERTFLGGFEQSPGCINVLDVDVQGAFIVRAVNHTPYDPAHVSAPRLTTMEQLWQEYLDSRDRNP